MKTGKSYYLCQLLGTFGFFSFIGWAGISDKIDEVDLSSVISLFFTMATISIFMSHFIVRVCIKKYQSSASYAFNIYSIAIFIAALVASILALILKLSFGNGEIPPLSFSSLFKDFIASGAIFSVWGLLYFALSAIKNRAIIKQQLKDHELASLMNQINPHFLFNSLNTIRGMIYEDKEKSAELVTKLSTLFRYNLANDIKAHTSLAGELEVCQHYLAIEDIRLGKRLKVSFDISPESKNAKIPTMGLLTLVENAIKHGISNLQQGGTLVLNTRIDNDKLIVEVSNPYQESLVKSGTQVGLKNLQQRVALIFGSQGQLNKTANNSTFTVNLTLPYQAV
jgi:hypothetical protein